MLTTGHQAHLAGLYQGAMIVPADNRSSVVTHARVVQLLRDLDVTVAWSLPTECLLWAASARANGLRPERDFPHLRGFLVAGEPLTAERRALISELWGGIPVYQDYGSTETGSLAGECGYGRLHLWADRFVPQVLDPVTGRSASTGTGELVITTLFREAMPLLRYNLRDRVRIADDDCRCGLGLPILEVLGRTGGDAVVAGTRITPQMIECAVFALPRRFGVMFWRARSLGTHLEIEFEVSEAHRDTAARQLRTEIADATGVESTVTAVPEGTFVPSSALTGLPEFIKPRNLFGETEDWDRAVTYW